VVIVAYSNDIFLLDINSMSGVTTVEVILAGIAYLTPQDLF